MIPPFSRCPPHSSLFSLPVFVIRPSICLLLSLVLYLFVTFVCMGILIYVYVCMCLFVFMYYFCSSYVIINKIVNNKKNHLFNISLIPCGKFWSPYLGKATASASAVNEPHVCTCIYICGYVCIVDTACYHQPLKFIIGVW